jgi:arylformamidase
MVKSTIIDISLPLYPELPVWPGDPPAIIEQTQAISRGHFYNSSRLQCSLHWGTHLDSPYHLIQDGWSIDEIPLKILLGKVQVLEVKRVSRITYSILAKYQLKPLERIIFKTRNSLFWSEKPLKFHPDFTALTADAAEFLLDLGVKLVGIDYLSLDLYEAKDLPVHKILYQKKVVGLEGLDLRKVSAGQYDLVCLPVKILKGDGAPARVLLIQKNEGLGQ